MNLQDYPLLRTDSYGKIFLYNTQNTTACVPRHIIRMTETVKPDVLQEAVSEALLRFPHMMLGVEPTETGFRYRQNVRPPVILPFDGMKRYCIGSKDNNGYLFLVGYQDKTIYMEYQHSISDGRGYEEFIRCVLFQYLKLLGHAVENDGSVRGMDTAFTPDESTDGYRKLADREFSPDGIWRKPEAVHAWELTNIPDSPEVVTEITFPFEQLHKLSKELSVSPLSIVAPLLMRAFDKKFGKGEDKPVISMIPVDLRQILPTATTRYFICFIDLPYLPEYRNLELPEVFRRTKAFLKTQMDPEQLMYRAKAASDRCLSLHEADIPLTEKCKAAQKTTIDFVLEDSFLITNVGRFQMPESCMPYIEDYGAILPCAVQPFAMLISSFGNNMKLSVAQRDHDFQVVETLVQSLKGFGIDAQTKSYPFVVTRYDGTLCGELPL